MTKNKRVLFKKNQLNTNSNNKCNVFSLVQFQIFLLNSYIVCKYHTRVTYKTDEIINNTIVYSRSSSVQWKTLRYHTPTYCERHTDSQRHPRR